MNCCEIMDVTEGINHSSIDIVLSGCECLIQWYVRNCQGFCTAARKVWCLLVCTSFKVGVCTGIFMVLGDRISGSADQITDRAIRIL
jgi:hypothetical protein